MSETDLGEIARTTAKEVFAFSTQCLMAHSIRAVESYIQQQRKLNYPITVRVGAHVQEMISKRALVVIEIGRSVIYVEKAVDFEHQRLAIAHELGHILLAFKVHKPGEPLGRLPGKMADDAAAIFEETLCWEHHKFYDSQTAVDRCKFPTLAARLEKSAKG